MVGPKDEMTEHISEVIPLTREEGIERWLAEGDALAAVISKKWPEGLCVADVMAQERR